MRFYLVVLICGCGIVLLALGVVVLLFVVLRRGAVVIVILLIHFYHLGSIVTALFVIIQITVCGVIKNFSVFIKS